MGKRRIPFICGAGLPFSSGDDFANEQKLNFIKEPAKYARSYIASEVPLLGELKPYRLKIPVHQIHRLMAFAELYVGEGATMASESAIFRHPGGMCKHPEIG